MSGNNRLVSFVLAVLLCLPAGCKHGAKKTSLKGPAEKVEIVEQHWPDGKLRLRKHVLKHPDGTAVNHGTYSRWYNNAQKEYEAVFVMGRKEGTATLWHRNGKEWTEEHYVDGKKHGARYTWDDDGRRRKEEHYFNGKPDGTWTVWDKKGRIKWQGSFDRGIPKP